MIAPPGFRLPRWPLVAAVPFLLYFCLLVYCEIRRLEPPGLNLDIGAQIVRSVTPGSPAATAGVAAGDILVTAGGAPVPTSMAWRAVEANLQHGTPLDVSVERDGHRLDLKVPVRYASPRVTTDRLALLAARIVQGITLALAFLMAARRPDDTLARIAALFLASVGVFTVELPLGFAATWRSLPWLVGALLWLPFTAWMAAGPLWFAFAALFPWPLPRAPLWWTLCAAPWLALTAWHVSQGVLMVYRPGQAHALPDWSGVVVTVSMAYAVAGVVLLILKYRRSRDTNERRRLRVVALGSCIGLAAGLPLILGRWLGAGSDGATSIFSSPWKAASMLLLLSFPASFAYAIVRHRMFGLALILRQGLRYTLARRLVLSLGPALVALAVADALAHGDQPLSQLIEARIPAYSLLLVLVAIAAARREVWLRRLDQRFFRERYNAQQLLNRVVEEIRRAADFGFAARTVASAVHDTLHPRFVQVLVKSPGTVAYTVVAAAPEGPTPDPPLPDSKAVGMLRVLGGPLSLLPSDTRWLDSHLPLEERDRLRRDRVDLLLLVSSPSAPLEALLVLGEKRSEEPYADEDRDLVSALAHSLGLVLERHPPQPVAAMPGFEECAACGTCHDSGTAACAAGHALTPVQIPRLLSGRYRLDLRLAQGGMGTVYAAEDVALGRQVAVKLIRDEISGKPGVLERFQREAKHLATFSHPHVVTVHDVGIAGGRPFLVMERVAGVTLRDELRTCDRLAPLRVGSLLKGLCSAVHEAHRSGLVHRDLKPENVMLTGANRDHPKIVDFGVARVWQASSAAATARDSDVGLLVGTLPYMPPEVLRGDEPGPYSDVWALAVMTYEMLTGALPYQSPLALAGGDSRPSISEPCRRFLERALSLNRDERPDSASAFLHGFEKAVQ